VKGAALRIRRARLEAELERRGKIHTLSLSRYRLDDLISKAAGQYIRGRCLDVGSGRSPYREALEANSDRLVSVDIEDRSGRLDLIADIQNMPELAGESFDSVVCTQVLEHVPKPWLAMTELARVLKPGGHAVLSVPHLSAVHEAPTDYFRYTRYGVESLCTDAGLEVEESAATGGWVAFVAHGLSAAFMSAVATLPGLFFLSWALNFAFLIRVAGIVDRLVGFSGLYPCDIVIVARKPSETET
jgi:SAM-dependent methyltransferase